VAINLEDYTKTKDLLVNTFFYHQTNEDDTFVRLSSTDHNYTIDLRKKPSVKAKMGVGTVHHIALSVDSLEEQAFQSQLKRLGYTPTEVKDRNYFKSIYFSDHNQILFELATKNPGFTIDEPLETLGETLKLPKQYETYRHQIEAVLLPFNKRVLRKSK
jgi:glyoxalase family protein